MMETITPRWLIIFDVAATPTMVALYRGGRPVRRRHGGTRAAIDYVHAIGREHIAAYDPDLLNQGTVKLLRVPGLRLIGMGRKKAAWELGHSSPSAGRVQIDVLVAALLLLQAGRSDRKL